MRKQKVNEKIVVEKLSIKEQGSVLGGTSSSANPGGRSGDNNPGSANACHCVCGCVPPLEPRS